LGAAAKTEQRKAGFDKLSPNGQGGGAPTRLRRAQPERRWRAKQVMVREPGFDKLSPNG